MKVQVQLNLPEEKKQPTLSSLPIDTYFVFQGDLTNMQEQAPVYQVTTNEHIINVGTKAMHRKSGLNEYPIQVVRIASIAFEFEQ